MRKSKLGLFAVTIALMVIFGAPAHGQWVTQTFTLQPGWNAVFLEVQPDGGYIVAGFTASFDTEGGSAFWVLKLNSDGSIDWPKTYDGTWSREDAHTITQNSDGGYIVAGINMESHKYQR